MGDARVLIAGYRQGLARALDRRGIAYAVWHHQPMRTLDDSVPRVIKPFGNSYDASREAALSVATEVSAIGRFSHVMAGTESAVVVASFARRALGARSSTHSTILRCHDKLAMKEHLREFEIPMAPFSDGNDRPAVRRLAENSARCVVKDRRSSGGRGIQIVEGDPESLDVSTRNRIVEGFIEAPEISVESFIHEGRICFSNITQYADRTIVNVLPAALPDDLRRSVLDLNRRVIEGLSIHWGMTHLEMYVTREGPLFGEIALRPPGGYIMECLPLAYGFDAWDAYVAVELGEAPLVREAAEAAAAVLILHPGAGKLTRIEGRKAAMQIPGVERIHLRAKVGDTIPARSRVGEDIGYALLRAANAEDLADSLAQLRATLEFVLD